MYDQELERFKSDINLIHYAIDRYGYQRDRRESSRGSHVMRHPGTGDKIIVRKAEGGHWTYFSVRDDRDNGTIIDFVTARSRYGSLGHVRQELREWLGTARPEPPYLPPPTVSPPCDRRALAAAFAAASAADNSPYLNARGIRPETLRAPRFAGTWGLDARGNTLFVHRADAGEITGFEIKNRGFTGFAPGGIKSAWQSAALPDDRTLVITESAIDALSYFQLHPERVAGARFLSTAGAPSPRQLELLGRVLDPLPYATTVIAALDSDAAGDKLATRIEDLVRCRAYLAFERHSPSSAKDWNEVLQRVEREYIRSLPARGRSTDLEHGR